MSLDKIRAWVASQGRTDVTAGRSERELAVLQRVARITMDLDGVVLFQGAKAGKGGEQHDLAFGRRMPGRKTPVVFCGVLFKPASGPWFRRTDISGPDCVRLCVKTTSEAAKRSAWAEKVREDDGLKPDTEWRFVEITPDMDLAGDPLQDLIEDAYYQVAGI
ncbi:MAG: hypothetical protein HMLKMBBP_01104 [Planctomycetes bacterium]|nr:hypothetical protein [Planctomycetota bacterium]